jgi:hypothetical protein
MPRLAQLLLLISLVGGAAAPTSAARTAALRGGGGGGGGVDGGGTDGGGAADQAELKKVLANVVSGINKDRPGKGATAASVSGPVDREAVMQALAESMGYGGDTAVEDLRATLSSINDDMSSIPPELLADSFARTIAGALGSLGSLSSHPAGEDIIVHAVGAAEGREGAALDHMTKHLKHVSFGTAFGASRSHVRIVMIGPEWSESRHKETTHFNTDGQRQEQKVGPVVGSMARAVTGLGGGGASIQTYRGLYSAETLHDLALPPPAVVICFNCDVYHCHWRPSLLFMLAQAR